MKIEFDLNKEIITVSGDISVYVLRKNLDRYFRDTTDVNWSLVVKPKKRKWLIF
jgi:hypothetical protein